MDDLNKLKDLMDKTENNCKNVQEEYKISHKNFLTLAENCKELFAILDKLNNNSIIINNISFNIMSNTEREKYVLLQKNYMDHIENISNKIKKMI